MLILYYFCSLFSDENQFELVDEKVEKLFDFYLKESLCRARRRCLFRVSVAILSLFSLLTVCGLKKCVPIMPNITMSVILTLLYSEHKLHVLA